MCVVLHGSDPLGLLVSGSLGPGLADPSALPQAVSTYQACHFIGMPECEVRPWPNAHPYQ